MVGQTGVLSILRKSVTGTAAASGWVGEEISFGKENLVIANIEISVPSTVDYSLPCYIEWEYHSGLQDAETHQLGHGTVQYRKPFVIQGPIPIEGEGKLLSAVFHHSTSHLHTMKVRYSVLS